MAKVYLVSAGAGVPRPAEKAAWDLAALQRSSLLDPFGVHREVADPAEADLILFVETGIHGGRYFELVRAHELYKRRRSRCYLYCATDKVVPLIPGVFPSIERRWYWKSWVRPGHYVGVRPRTADDDRAHTNEPGLLFSFAGSGLTHPVRRAVLKLRHRDAEVVDTSAVPTHISAEVDDMGAWSRYVALIRNSAFVLCPRGGGAASFRLFEAMMLGSVPVIISDEWVSPIGPQWSRISVRVREQDVTAIPMLLEGLRDHAQEMGRAARQAWLEWFSPDVSFHRIVQSCTELQDQQARRAGVRRLAPYSQFLRPYHCARRASIWVRG